MELYDFLMMYKRLRLKLEEDQKQKIADYMSLIQIVHNDEPNKLFESYKNLIDKDSKENCGDLVSGKAKQKINRLRGDN